HGVPSASLKRILPQFPSLLRGIGMSPSGSDVAALDKMLQIAETPNAYVRGDDGEVYRRSGQGFECYGPAQGWLSLEEFHRGRPDWAPVIIREIALRSS